MWRRVFVLVLGWGVGLLVLLAVGTLVHELGHGVVVWCSGGRLTRLVVLGVQLWPRLAWVEAGGYWGWVSWQGQFTPTQTAWIDLGGNMATWLMALVGLVGFWRFRRWGWALVTLAFLDVLTHTLPTFGLPMYLVFGRRAWEDVSEGYVAAMALGVPGWIWQVAVVGYALAVVILLVQWGMAARRGVRDSWVSAG